MNCPYCGQNIRRVVNKENNGTISRRLYSCKDCHKTFTTIEQIDTGDYVYVLVEKVNSRNNKRERMTFDRREIYSNLVMAVDDTRKILSLRDICDKAFIYAQSFEGQTVTIEDLTIYICKILAETYSKQEAYVYCAISCPKLLKSDLKWLIDED